MAKYDLYPGELFPVWSVHPKDDGSNTQVELTDEQVIYFVKAFEQFIAVQKELVAIAKAQGLEIGAPDGDLYSLDEILPHADTTKEPGHPEG